MLKNMLHISSLLMRGIAGLSLFVCAQMSVSASNLIDTSKYQYKDNFDDEREKSNPSHWIENNKTDYWKVYSDRGNKVYRIDKTESLSYSWLHVFEKNVVFESRFKIKKAVENALIQVSLRYNHADAQVFAQYNFKDRCWYLFERQGTDFKLFLRGKSKPEPLKVNIWNNIKIISDNNTVKLYVNNMDQPKILTDSIVHLSPGRVAFAASRVEAFFDDVSLNLTSKQGRVNDGVLEYNLNPEDGNFREGATIFEKQNGDLILLHRWEEYLSTNKGQTFEGPNKITWPYNGHAHHNIIRLKSGKILKIVAEYNGLKRGFDTSLRFRSKLSDDDGATWYDGGLTWENFREGIPGSGVSDAIVMNDKISQMPDGRVFFVVTVRKNDGTKVTGHKQEIYFSDDEGKTWRKSTGDTGSISNLKHYAEGKIIHTSEGKLRLYTPWNEELTVRYSESSDNGQTWVGDIPVDKLRNSRSSFALIEDPYAKSTTFYMVWVYDDKSRSNVIFLPRTRLGLARSYDGINWEYMMDVERWISPDNKKKRMVVQILDPSLTATKDYLYVTIGRSEKADTVNGHNQQRLRVYRIEKSKMKAYDSWPTEY